MMPTRVLGVGVGLFVVVSLWVIAVIVCFISVRTQKNIGLAAFSVALIISLILIFIPRESGSESSVEALGISKVYDSIFVWRITLVILLGLSSVAAFLIFLFTHLMEPKHSKLRFYNFYIQLRATSIMMTSFGVLVGSSVRMFRPAAKVLRCFVAEKKFSCSPTVKKVYNVDSNADFEAKVMNSTAPVIVNFHADWCDPCKILSPKLEELVRAQDDVDLAVVDVEKNPELVHTFEVKAVPSVIAVRNGFVVDKYVGLMDADTIESLMDKLVNRRNC